LPEHARRVHQLRNTDAICSTLERNKIRCWYAPRDVGTGTYAASIIEAIKNSKVFVLVLNQNASESPHVLNEVETAYKRIKDGLTIMPFKISDNVSEEMESIHELIRITHICDAPILIYSYLNMIRIKRHFNCAFDNYVLISRASPC